MMHVRIECLIVFYLLLFFHSSIYSFVYGNFFSKVQARKCTVLGFMWCLIYLIVVIACSGFHGLYVLQAQVYLYELGFISVMLVLKKISNYSKKGTRKEKVEVP